MPCNPAVKRIEIRRHSHRNPPDAHLSPEGLALAQRVGGSLGPFARVVSSPAPRARETAEAMGFAVEREVPELLPDMAGLWTNEDFDRARTFADYARALAERPGLRTLAERQARLWLDLTEDIAEGAALLAISHGGIIEFGALAALVILPPPLRGRVGVGDPSLGLCEGVAVVVATAGPRSIEILRVS